MIPISAAFWERWRSSRPRPASACARDGIRDVFIPRYRQIADLAAKDGDPLAIAATNYMVIHEVALLDALDRILAGEANPTHAIDALLHFPLGAVPA